MALQFALQMGYRQYGDILFERELVHFMLQAIALVHLRPDASCQSDAPRQNQTPTILVTILPVFLLHVLCSASIRGRYGPSGR